MRKIVLFSMVGLILSAPFAGAEISFVVVDDPSALIIGQQRYNAVIDVMHAQRDAVAVGDRLTQLGFETELALNLTYREMHRVLDRFAESVRRSGSHVGLIYYVGHGTQSWDGHDYLIPVDVELPFDIEADLRAGAIRVADVVARMSRTGDPLIIMLLDMGRGRIGSNGHASNWASPLEARARPRGAPYGSIAGTAILFSTRPGEPGDGGVFADELLNAWQIPRYR